MQPSNLTFLSAFSFKPVLVRAALLGALTLAVVVPSGAQVQSPKLRRNSAHVHWHKYVNHEFGFSLWYPETYTRSSFEITGVNTYRKFLLLLQQPDDSDSSISVTIIVARPFFVEDFQVGGFPPVRRKIGRHDFYCGMGGSMGAGFSDECIFNLRGRMLEISFSPALPPNSAGKTNSLVIQVLKTFRVL